jgi:hypothetical protein
MREHLTNLQTATGTADNASATIKTDRVDRHKSADVPQHSNSHQMIATSNHALTTFYSAGLIAGLIIVQFSRYLAKRIRQIHDLLLRDLLPAPLNVIL